MSRFLTPAVFVAAAHALALAGAPAQATDAVVPDATFYHPEITQGPSVKELLRRAAGDETILIGPDNTCGYVSGRPGAPITCNGAYTCALIYGEDYGRAGCYSDPNYGIRATCYDYRQVYQQSACDDGCLQDTYTLKCTETTASYCNTITFFSGIIDFFCGALSISTPQQLYTTYAGQTNAKTWQQLVVTASDSATGGSSSNSASDGSDDFSFPSSTFSSPTSSPTGGNGGGGGNNSGGDSDNGNGNGNGSGNGSGNGGGNGSGSDNGSNGGNGSSVKSSTPVGPIVGGVVGGVGGIALIGLGIFLFLRYRNKHKKVATPEQSMLQTAAVGGTAPPPPGAPGYPPQGDNNVQHGQPPYQGHTPPPNVYYPPEQKTTGFVSMTPTGVPDRHDSTSPVSQFSDPRHSTQTHSPTSTLNSNWGSQPPQPGSPNVPPTVYEAGGNVVGERDYNSNHHGQFHEMA
ncbi:hypothetical protein F5Y14DRAFT_353752 [Nemania sp. NC0429]|nr:hypothetical protein F5Y14DRAFT_353752 [Nemania sp. NC0429]